MKTIKSAVVALALLLALASVGLGEEAAYGSGLTRTEGGVGFALARGVAERYGVPLTDGLPLYAPARPQPMNAYMIIDPDCQVGIDGDDMYPVDEKGLTPDLTAYLTACIGDIEAQSDGLIRFVADPDDADVLVSASQTFKYHGSYSGGGRTAEGYACAVTLTAAQLSAPDNRARMTAAREPEDTVTLRGGERFWIAPPELSSVERLGEFVKDILGWYGLGAEKGSKGAGVKALQQALIDRGFLKDRADGAFGGKTGEGVKRLQAYCGLEPTGVVDRATLLAVYYEM